MMSEFRKERAVVHFVGGNTVTIEGDWFDRFVRHGAEMRPYQVFGDMAVNMSNVTYVEVTPIEDEEARPARLDHAEELARLWSERC